MSFFNSYSKAVARQHTETGMSHGDFFVTVEAVMEEYTRVDNVVEPEVTVNVEPTIHPEQDGVMPHTADEIEMRFEKSVRRAARPINNNLKDSAKESRRDLRDGDDASNERSGRVGANTGKTKSKTDRPKKPTSKERKAHKKSLKKLGGGYRVRVKLDKVVVNDSDGIRPG